jgi:hypothetical protein
MQTITLELPETVYQSAQRLAQASHESLESVLQAGIAHALLPLDDVPPEEAHELAQLALLDDATLWQQARLTMSSEQEHTLQELLDRQSEGELTAKQRTQLEHLMRVYGQLTVRKAHAYLLLARRGYRIPLQADVH